MELVPESTEDDGEGGGGSGGEYASREEAEAAIHALTDTDYVKLGLIAQTHWKERWLRDLMSPQELLSEAILRTLAPGDRPRRWRKAAVSLIEHLDRAMESISGHAIESAVRETECLDVITAEDFDSRTDTPRRYHRPEAENRLLAKEQLEQIERSFGGARPALDLLRLKAEGYSESEITNRLGMNKRSYAAARKKAEREIAKYIVQSERKATP